MGVRVPKPIQVDDTRTGQVAYWPIPKQGVKGDQLESELKAAKIIATPYLVDLGNGEVLGLGNTGPIDTEKAAEVIATHKPKKD